MSEHTVLLSLCETCPDRAIARKIDYANDHIEQLPAECVILARELLRLGNCHWPRIELDLVNDTDGDVISVERFCNNPYSHDIYRVIRAGEIIRSHTENK